MTSLDEREQLLISKAVDGDITDHEWIELEQRAEQSGSLWRELARSHRDHHGLTHAMDLAGGKADGVAVPFHVEAHEQLEPVAGRIQRATSWSGWAVAALITIFVLTRMHVPGGGASSHISNGNQAQMANLMQINSADDAFRAYLDKGQASGLVLGEVPTRILLESRPNQNGDGYELLFLRQVIERTIVPDVYAVSGADELGRPTLIRYADQLSGDSL